MCHGCLYVHAFLKKWLLTESPQLDPQAAGQKGWGVVCAGCPPGCSSAAAGGHVRYGGFSAQGGSGDHQTLELYGSFPPVQLHQVAAVGFGSDPMLLGRKGAI